MGKNNISSCLKEIILDYTSNTKNSTWCSSVKDGADGDGFTTMFQPNSIPSHSISWPPPPLGPLLVQGSVFSFWQVVLALGHLAMRNPHIIEICIIKWDLRTRFEEQKLRDHSQGNKEMKFLLAPVGLRNYVSSLIAFFIIVFSVSLLFDRGQEAQVQRPVEQHGSPRGGEGCDFSSGRWVYDNISRPLYSGLNCTFMNDEVACDKYGREDTMYQHWRWQPHGCDLPRFNATRLLEEIRGKRLVFVGDSLNRNQWVSLVCMVESSIPKGLKTRIFNGSLVSFKALEYNATIDFYWSPLLVESNCDDPIIHRVAYRIMRAEAIEKHAKYWKNADIIVFNSYLWWKKPNMKMKVMYGAFEDNDASLEEVEMAHGFELALRTWSKWLQMYISRTKTKIFFASLSPTHVWAKEWGGEDTKNCLGETEPIYEDGYIGGSTDYGMMRKAESIIDMLKHNGVHVQILNVTQMSDYRKDAHPSVFRRQFVPLTKEQLANPKSYADCTHWCLPGVPDVWNEILYAHLISQ